VIRGVASRRSEYRRGRVPPRPSLRGTIVSHRKRTRAIRGFAGGFSEIERRAVEERGTAALARLVKDLPRDCRKWRLLALRWAVCRGHRQLDDGRRRTLDG